MISGHPSAVGGAQDRERIRLSETNVLPLCNATNQNVLIYGPECFALAKSDLKSLDFAVNRFLMKLFRSNNIEIIAECRRYFQFNLPSELI